MGREIRLRQGGGDAGGGGRQPMTDVRNLSRHRFLQLSGAGAAALDGANRVTGWRHRIATHSIASTFESDVKLLGDRALNQGIIDMPFAIPNLTGDGGKPTGVAILLVPVAAASPLKPILNTSTTTRT